MTTADESLADGGISGYGTRREDEVGRDNCPGGTFLRSTVMVLIPMSGPTYM